MTLGINEIDATNLGSRLWYECAGGTLWWDGNNSTDQPGTHEKLDEQYALVLRVSIDLATTAEGVAAFNANAVADWLDGLGGRDVTALAIFRRGNHHLMHVTEILPGRPVDYAAGKPVTAPRVIDLGTDPTWPQCLNAAVFAPTRHEFIGARALVAA